MNDPFAEVKAHFAHVDDVVVGAGQGSQGMKVGKKMFAMFYKGDLVVKLNPERVTELVASGEALAFDPGTGTPMRDRARVPESQRGNWIALAEESHQYAKPKR